MDLPPEPLRAARADTERPLEGFFQADQCFSPEMTHITWAHKFFPNSLFRMGYLAPLGPGGSELHHNEILCASDYREIHETQTSK